MHHTCMNLIAFTFVVAVRACEVPMEVDEMSLGQAIRYVFKTHVLPTQSQICWEQLAINKSICFGAQGFSINSYVYRIYSDIRSRMLKVDDISL